MEILALTNKMPSVNNGTNSPVDIMKKNYKSADEITADLKNIGLDEFLKHDVHGRFGFYLCEGCGGPILGHIQTKCRGLTESYDSQTVNKFQNWLERLPDFKKQVEQRKLTMEDRQAELQARKLGEAVNLILQRTGAREANPATTQLVKARFPPIWTGKKFDKWKKEVEKWRENNKSTEEEKYVDLLESLKKNEAIKDYVTKTLVEKIGDVRTVDRVLTVMSEKYSMTICEKITEVMKTICGFRTDDKVDTLIDKFDELLVEVQSLNLMTARFKYALSSQFVDRLEAGGKINSTERLRLKDLLEDSDGKPKPGDTTDDMKRELKRLKIVENREEPFANKKEETRAYYTRNDSNQDRFENRSRYDSWRNNIKNDGFKRSGTNPQFFRTDSRRRWIRDDSRYGGRSRSRQSEAGRTSSRADSRPRRDSRPGSKFRNRSKSVDRPKSELMKKIEVMEKDITAMKNSNKNVEEMVKKLTISTKYVEEEIFIDVKYVEKEIENLMIVDSGAPVSLMSSAWLNNYLKEAKVDLEEVEKSSSN